MSAASPAPQAATIKVGDRFPAGQSTCSSKFSLLGQVLFENLPDNAVDLDTLFKGKKILIFSVPGFNGIHLHLILFQVLLPQVAQRLICLAMFK